GTPVFHIPAAFRMKGPLDSARLERAIAAIVARHEALRTVLEPAANDDGAVQRILPAVAGPLLPVTDLSGDPGREEALKARMREEAARPFDLQEGPLFRARLYRLAADDHVLFWMPHHAIWDGASFGVFVDELNREYAGGAGEALRFQYG